MGSTEMRAEEGYFLKLGHEMRGSDCAIGNPSNSELLCFVLRFNKASVWISHI